MSEKVVIVTGATSGIGKETVEGIAKTGATVVMMCRNLSLVSEIKKEIEIKTGNTKIDIIGINLSSLVSVKAAVQEFKSKYSRLDVLINNAGISLPHYEISEEAYEKVFATNHLGPFLLTNMLLDLLKKSAPSRIINVASKAQAPLDYQDLMSERNFSALKVYSQSKAANILFTYDLARKLENSGITVNCLHPGVVRTRLARDYEGWTKALLYLFVPFFISPQKGAETSIYLATSPDVENVTGQYFIKNKIAKSNPFTYNIEAQKQLWKLSAQFTDLRN